MIDTPTLFILGAGASKPYGYLTGAELRADIIEYFANDFSSLSDINSINIPFDALDVREKIGPFVKNFDESSLTSIDKYLAINTDDSYIGKIAITLSILKSERDSCFNEKIDDSNEDWYQYLYNRMTDDFKKPEDHKHFFKNQVAFITFNYDRSLEYYLYNSFYHSFSQQRTQIKNNIRDYVPFEIIHVYGTVGTLSLSDWYDNIRDYRHKFGYFNYLKDKSKGIWVIGEESSGVSIKDQIKKLLLKYKRIFFLGFGYAQENLDAIDLMNNIDHTSKIYGTAKGMTTKEIRDVNNCFLVTKGTLHSVGNVRHRENDKYIDAIIKDAGCYQLLREYL